MFNTEKNGISIVQYFHENHAIQNKIDGISIVQYRITGWWFGTFFFPYIGNNHPNWLSYFSERLKPPTRNKIPWKFHQSTGELISCPGVWLASTSPNHPRCRMWRGGKQGALKEPQEWRVLNQLKLWLFMIYYIVIFSIILTILYLFNQSKINYSTMTWLTINKS